MELDAVDEGVVADGAGVCGPGADASCSFSPQRRTSAAVTPTRRHQVDVVDLDEPRSNVVPPTHFHLGSRPEPERQGDRAGQHRLAQLGTELHVISSLGEPGRDRGTELPARVEIGW